MYFVSLLLILSPSYLFLFCLRFDQFSELRILSFYYYFCFILISYRSFIPPLLPLNFIILFILQTSNLVTKMSPFCSLSNLHYFNLSCYSILWRKKSSLKHVVFFSLIKCIIITTTDLLIFIMYFLFIEDISLTTFAHFLTNTVR